MPSPALHLPLAFVLRWEGGFVDDPDDPGGRTNKGVTQKVYDSWRTRQGLPQRDVKVIDGEEVAAIYETDYWTPPRCDALSPPLDLAVFDTAVNMGVRRSVRILQSALGCKVDGDFGAKTEAAVAGCDVGATVAVYCRTREDVYRSLVVKNPKLDRFLKGWLNRLNSLRREAGLPGYESAREDVAQPTARIPDIGEGEALEGTARE
jgi:lysozyme family protein